jgi:hypothetical protein
MRVATFRLEAMMPDGKHDFADFRDEQSVLADRPPSMSELLAKLDELEKELGQFVRETFREANSTGTARE